jgi:2-dehydro-3-deoxy-D-arabinonate dehydratase
MLLTRHLTRQGPRWALDRQYLPAALDLTCLLAMSGEGCRKLLESLPPGAAVEAEALAPIDHRQEVWACGVTYQRSRDARQAESQVAT